MPDKQSEKCPFKSRFAPSLWLSPSQYLAENMVSRKARSKGGGDLPMYFWRNELLNREFQLQVRHAAALLRLYSVDAIVRALRTKEGSKIYSLAAQWLDPLIRAEQEKIDRQAAARAAAPAPEPVPVTTTDEGAAPRPAFVPPNTRSKLKGL